MNPSNLSSVATAAESSATQEPYTISSRALSVRLIDIGASIYDVRLEGVGHPLVLGLSNLHEYPTNASHMGAVAGRVANRIAGGQFEIHGREYQGPRNLADRDMLHGGPDGFGTRVWTPIEHSATHVRFELKSADGDAGFPGEVRASVTYTCVDSSTLEIEIGATTTQPTFINLAPHAYFNLSDEANIDNHVLTIAADHYTPVSELCIPTGEVREVHDEFDFRQAKAIGHFAHDQNYCLANLRRSEPAFAAQLEAGGIRLTVETTEPGLQLYTGDNLNDGGIDGLEGRRYAKRAGICLESQCWPDAPHHAHFPSILITPDEPYRHVTRYRFDRSD